METIIKIKGIHCNACKMLIEDVCTEIEGISSCSVNLTGERATITHDTDVNLNKLKEEIEGLGDYTVEIK